MEAASLFLSILFVSFARITLLIIFQASHTLSLSLSSRESSIISSDCVRLEAVYAGFIMFNRCNRTTVNVEVEKSLAAIREEVLLL